MDPTLEIGCIVTIGERNSVAASNELSAILQNNAVFTDGLGTL